MKLVIAFDTTGSMAPCIKEVRRRLHEFSEVVFKEIEDLEVQFIAFGDYCDMPRHYFTSPVAKSAGPLQEWLKDNHSTYGGDGPEFYEYVMKRVREETTWKDKNAFILLGDSEPHEVGYSYGGKTYRIDWEEEAKLFAEAGIPIYTVKALSYRTEFFYKEVARLTNGIQVDLDQLSHIVEFITAIGLKAHGEESLDRYEKKLSSSNRSLRTMFAKLRGKEVTFAKIVDSSGNELVPVDPSRFQTLYVDHDCPIKNFVEESGARFKVGRGFYQFKKTETIQERKEVVLRDREGNFFTGEKAREMIGVPYGTRDRLRPAYLREYDIFVQSTSYNRKLKRGSEFLYEIEV